MTDEVQDTGFLEHLDQLRTVLLKIFVFFAVICIPCWFLAPKMLEFLIRYAAPAGFKLHYFSLMEPFFTQLKIMAAMALVLTLPWGAYCLWKFAEPGLLPEERKAVKVPAAVMILLALGGTVLSAFFIIPLIIKFSLSFAGPGMEPLIGVGDFTGLILAVLLAGMILFQFPVILYFLLWLGILDVESLRRKRPHIIVVIFILAAVFSPPDVCSQILLAIPAWLLFEASIFIFSKRFEKDRSFEQIYKDADLPLQKKEQK